MDWLVTFSKKVDFEAVRLAIQEIGGKMDSSKLKENSVDDEIVIAVNGPDTMSDDLKKKIDGRIEIYPNSQIGLYDDIF